MTDFLYRMQQRNERAKQSRRQLADRVKDITSALADGIIILTPDRELEWWNPAAEKLLGLVKQDRGQSMTNLVRDPRFVVFIQSDALPSPLELSSPEDPTRTLLFTAATFGDGNIILVVQDITRLRNLEQMRQDFVANISHELRTPLTVLSGYIETLQDNADQLPRGWAKALLQMGQQTERLNALANDLVMLSQLESNRKPPRGHPSCWISYCNRLPKMPAWWLVIITLSKQTVPPTPPSKGNTRNFTAPSRILYSMPSSTIRQACASKYAAFTPHRI